MSSHFLILRRLALASWKASRIVWAAMPRMRREPAGKTDILVRVEDRHVFIGECKSWKGPKTISDTLDQLLGYLVWRDNKAARLLFIRRGNPTEIIAKSLEKIRSHPSFKREGTHSDEFGERYNFVFHANGDESREIKLAFLPFVLLTPSTS
ncbi:hypothetical protein ACGFYM_39805 [Streptomyces sp. NPDC048231]|uniref:hypothetical protein n=1 Tax=Streptomyces sp. NPDC048231 TaxID=3365519 RepID=UPI00371AF568